jgi:hypothetical protein
MKTLVRPVCGVSLVAVRLASLAQSHGSPTSAQVQVEIAQLQQAGYNPANANAVDFPANLPAINASAAVCARREAQLR